MRIIKPGKPIEPKSAKVICPKCDCEFEVFESECSELVFGGDIIYYCPHCSYRCLITKNEFKVHDWNLTKKPLPPPATIDQLVILAEQDPRNK